MLRIPETVSGITSTLEAKGFDAYLVGGCVRDLLLGKTPKDWDITTNAAPEQIIALFPKTVYQNDFGTVTVVNEDASDPSLKNIEITPFRKEAKYSDKRHPDKVTFGHSLEEDLARRDFTINAVSYSVSKGQIVDPYKGQKDMEQKVIRTVGDPKDRFEEDPLRIWRGIRLASQLGFALNKETADSMQKKAQMLDFIAKERIRDEFTKIIMSKNPMIGLVLSHKLNVLRVTIPELEEGVHMKQNGEHKYDVWEHILRTLQHAADKDYSLHVRLGALCHDIGKPRTRQWSKEKNDWTFYGHDVVGAKMTKEILARLRFPVKTIESVTKLVRSHMFFTDIDKITLSAVRRIINRVGRDEVWDLMRVRFCDRIGMGRPKETPYRLRKYESMIEEALRSPTSVGMLKIKGNDVLRETGLEPGPKIGLILHALLEGVLDNPELNTREYLTNKAKELAKMPENELKELGESGKKKKDEVEQAAIGEIRKRHFVK